MNIWHKQASPILSALVLVWGVAITVLLVLFYFSVEDGLSSISASRNGLYEAEVGSSF